MFNRKTSILFLALSFLSCLIFLYSGLISPWLGVSLVLLLTATLVFFYLRSEASSKKILLKQEDAQEKLNTLSSDIQSRKEYLYYLPESAQRLNFFKKLTEQLTQRQELENIYAFLGNEIKNIFRSAKEPRKPNSYNG